MKILLRYLFAIILLISAQPAIAQADDIVGIWWNQEKDAHIQVYKSGNTYAGKIAWLKNPNNPKTGKPKVDDDNPDKKMRTSPLLGLKVVYGFTYDADDKEWSGGKIYDARSGKTYNCYLSLKDHKTLKVRGYVGASWMGLGETNTWTRKE